MVAPETKLAPDEPNELSTWLWLWLPLGLYLLHVVAAVILPYEVYNTWFTSELGLSEEGTTLCLAIALVLGGWCAWRFAVTGRPQLALWFAIFALGCLYFGGEEASWGQHWFGWHTPEEWQALNEQKELNVHNAEGWVGSMLDQLPRNLLTLGAFVAGGVMPLARRVRNRHLHPATRAYWILPTLTCAPSALVASLGSVPKHIRQAYFPELAYNMEAGEVKELLLAFFLLMYALSALQRLRRQGAA